MGLPLALCFAEAGHQVIGIDVSRPRVDSINSGSSYIDDVTNKRLVDALCDAEFLASTDFALISQTSAIVLCVPTPLTRQRIPDMTYVVNAATSVSQHLKAGHLVVLESTTYPGTTDELVRPILERSGLTAGTDFSLAFSPERVDPGSTSSSGYSIRNTPKIVGGVTSTCTVRASALYDTIVDEIVPVSSPRIAEMSKLFENIFRNVNIALVNELALVCERMDLNVWEILEAAGTKPFGFMRFRPGPGVGGHCIPVDPFYLTWKAREYGVHTRFIELAGEINEMMPRHVTSRVADALNARGKSVKGSTVLALGVAYKRNISDTRESPALTVVELLLESGATVCYHDSYVPEIHVKGGTLRSVDLTADLIRTCECVVVLTDHDNIDYDFVACHASLVIDTRNRIQPKSDISAVVTI